MSNEVAFNSLEKDDVKISFNDDSRVPLKPTDTEIAQHRKTRLVLVVVFGVIVLVMVVVAIIIIAVSPQCEPKTTPAPGGSEGNNGTVKANETADDSWWKHAVIYQVFPRSFFDGDDNGDGDLKGIVNKIEYFGDLGVNALLLSPIFKSSVADGGFDVEDYTSINAVIGSMEDFDKLLKAAKEKGLKILMDFVPNHTSEKHPWFLKSKGNKINPKRDWYVWRDGTGGNKTDPPNNWLSVSGGSAWEYDNVTEQFYLHQFKKNQPDLNLRNQDVKNELKKALKFWLEKGVDGFRFDSVQYFVEDVTFKSEEEKTGYNASDPMYDMLDHKYTFDLAEDLEIVQEFREFLKGNESNPLLIAEVRGDYNETSPNYFEKVQIPENFGLISKVKRTGMTLSQGIFDTIIDYLNAVPKGKTPNWIIGNYDEVRVGSRDNVGKENRNAMNALLLTLPGVAISYYGEEIGMLNGNITNLPDPQNNGRTPMQWDDSANAGFTSSSNTWLPVTSDYKTVNVKSEKAVLTSFYNNYIKLVKLRKKPAFVSDDVKPVHKDKDVVSYIRGSDDQQYQVAINFGDTMWTGDFDYLSGRGVVVFDSESDKPPTSQVDVNKIKLNPGQVIIISRGNETWHEQ